MSCIRLSIYGNINTELLQCTNKWSFPLKISSVNATKSAVCYEFGRIYWRSPYDKTSLFMQYQLKQIRSHTHLNFFLHQDCYFHNCPERAWLYWALFLAKWALRKLVLVSATRNYTRNYAQCENSLLISLTCFINNIN